MTKRIYFIIAVVFSLLLPILFSLVYLFDQNKNYKEASELAKVDIKPEIFNTSSDVINNLEDVAILEENFESIIPYEFTVLYSDLNSDGDLYQIYLTDLKLPQNLDLSLLRWKLLIFDYNSKKYIPLSSGDFANINPEKMIISPKIEISNNEIQRFKLYYYQVYEPLTNSNYVGNEFNALVELE